MLEMIGIFNQPRQNIPKTSDALGPCSGSGHRLGNKCLVRGQNNVQRKAKGATDTPHNPGIKSERLLQNTD